MVVCQPALAMLWDLFTFESVAISTTVVQKKLRMKIRLPHLEVTFAWSSWRATITCSPLWEAMTGRYMSVKRSFPFGKTILT